MFANQGQSGNLALTVLDALDSVKWAMIFAKWGSEHDIAMFVDFFGNMNMVRDCPCKIPQVRDYYKKCSWDLASHLRAGETFAEGVKKVVTSPHRSEALAKWMPPDTPKKGKGKFAKGHEKGQGKETWLQPSKGRSKGKPWTPMSVSPPAQPGPYIGSKGNYCSSVPHASSNMPNPTGSGSGPGPTATVLSPC